MCDGDEGVGYTAIRMHARPLGGSNTCSRSDMYDNLAFRSCYKQRLMLYIDLEEYNPCWKRLVVLSSTASTLGLSPDAGMHDRHRQFSHPVIAWRRAGESCGESGDIC